MKRLSSTILAVGLGLMGTIGSVQAAPIPAGSFYTDVIGGGIGDIVVMTGGGSAPGIGDPTGRNDDGFSGPIDCDLCLFGQQVSFFVNNNGSISFGAGVSTFTPDPLNTTVPTAMIAPYWADVDTRAAASGVAHLRNTTPGEFIVTWENVGYFNSHADKLVSFQLVFRDSNFVGPVPLDEGHIGFFYKTMDWETGDASGGTAGFGGTEATAGFGDGLLAINPGELSIPGSQTAGISDILEDRHFWFTLDNCIPTPVPEPGTLALLGLGVVGIGYARRRKA